MYVTQIALPFEKSYYLCNIDKKLTPSSNCFRQSYGDIAINLVGSQTGFYRYETYADKVERRVVGIKVWSNNSEGLSHELFCDGWGTHNSIVISSATNSMGSVATGIAFDGDEAGFLRDFRLTGFASQGRAKSRGKIRHIVKKA